MLKHAPDCWCEDCLEALALAIVREAMAEQDTKEAVRKLRFEDNRASRFDEEFLNYCHIQHQPGRQVPSWKSEGGAAPTKATAPLSERRVEQSCPIPLSSSLPCSKRSSVSAAVRTRQNINQTALIAVLAVLATASTVAALLLRF